jgi:heme/copper-type cytochrome/quinol oxidase subunit 2
MHGFMPITSHAVYAEDFIAWIKKNGQII